MLCLFICSQPLQPLASTDLFAVFIVLPFQECHIAEIIKYIVFSDWLSLCNMHLKKSALLRYNWHRVEESMFTVVRTWNVIYSYIIIYELLYYFLYKPLYTYFCPTPYKFIKYKFMKQKCSCTFEKNVYFVSLGWKVLYVAVKSIWCRTLFNVTISLLIFVWKIYPLLTMGC